MGRGRKKMVFKMQRKTNQAKKKARLKRVIANAKKTAVTK